MSLFPQHNPFKLGNSALSFYHLPPPQQPQSTTLQCLTQGESLINGEGWHLFFVYYMKSWWESRFFFTFITRKTRGGVLLLYQEPKSMQYLVISVRLWNFKNGKIFGQESTYSKKIFSKSLLMNDSLTKSAKFVLSKSIFYVKN